MNLPEKLEQLSAAATQGEWREAGGDAILTGRDSSLVVIGSLTASENDPLFVSTLVNLYRTGQLVAVQVDDATVERVLRSNLATMQEQRSRMQRWNKSHAELNKAITETEAAIAALSAKGDA